MLRSIYRFGRSVLNRSLGRFGTPLLVLLYHRVTTLESDPYLLAVTPANFRSQMEYLKNNFQVLRFEEDWSSVNKPSVVVTFDDGYADNLCEALPILEEIGVPATFFIATGTFVNGAEFWWDELESIILGQQILPSRFDLKDREHGRQWPTRKESEIQRLHHDLLSLMKKIDTNRREQWLNQLRQWSGRNNGTRASHRPMTVDELRVLAKNPMVTIGSHGVTHAALSSMTPIQQKQELESSKRKLEDWLKQQILVYAYPYGDRAAYTNESVRLCKEVGYIKSAAVNSSGPVHPWTDLYQIPRLMILNWPLNVFARKISPFLNR
ncbi:MAG: polysaccharide deacetylase family protein [Planctomycetota bacterium]|jgi:peptidoglycan/xylan/chitin deacetylase (PgdA/CDA1 family)